MTMQLFYPGEDSVLRPEMVVSWKRERGTYNFDSLPATAIICVDYSILRPLKTWGTRSLKGIKGKHFVKGSLLFCSEFDNGAPGLINLLEELRVLGVRQFVFLGSAGILSPAISEGTVLSVSRALSGNGIASFYTDVQATGAHEQDFYRRIQSQLALKETCCYSTDAPYRETRSLLNVVSGAGAELIDMECAAVYAFATFYDLSAICLLVAADKLLEAWTPPGDFPGMIQQQKRLLEQLIKVLNA